MATSRLDELTSKLRDQTNESSRESSQAKYESADSASTILFLGTNDDREFLHLLKGMFGSFRSAVICTEIGYLTQLDRVLKESKITRVVSTSPVLLKRLVGFTRSDTTESVSARIDDYAGSIFDYKGCEVLFIDPLSHLFTIPYGRFITQRFISKLTAPHTWREATEFKWDILVPSNIRGWYEIFSQSFAMAVDIETIKGPRPTDVYIKCISFTGIFLEADSFQTTSIVLPILDEWSIIWMRKFCDLPVQKIFQRGKYDNNYLIRYSCPVNNWLWDTANCLHCWYSELPKDLGFQNAFFLRKVVYWKDLADTTDLHEYYRYNALDGWATANVWIEWMLSAPDCARRNYVLEFPVNFGCMLCELTGIERDIPRMVEARQKYDEEEARLTIKLRTILGAPDFNVNSPPQVVTLMRILGDSEATSSDEKSLKRAKLRHPFNNLVFTLVEEIRELRKRRSTYLRLDSDATKQSPKKGKEFRGRILYTLLTDGTDTGRLASREHHFWCGLQIQNIPVGDSVKQTLKASEGFYFGESDLEQAESRDTGYISGDIGLINAVESPRDFHSVNCSAFFGLPYADIYDDVTRKTKDKKLRDLSKRVNHGFNYNMGVWMLIETMGPDKVWEAGKILGLPTSKLEVIAQYLLDCADRTYPGIKGTYYESVKSEVATTSRLTSRAFHHTEFNDANYEPLEYIERGDWVRYCFGRPDKGKSALNSYVAHCPQSLNARTLNEAFIRVFYEIALPNPGTFRLHAQIHDSILFSYAIGFEHLAERVRQIMQIPVTIKDVSGIIRKFVVPAALKIGSPGKPAVYWSEIE